MTYEDKPTKVYEEHIKGGYGVFWLMHLAGFEYELPRYQFDKEMCKTLNKYLWGFNMNYGISIRRKYGKKHYYLNYFAHSKADVADYKKKHGSMMSIKVVPVKWRGTLYQIYQRPHDREIKKWDMQENRMTKTVYYVEH